MICFKQVSKKWKDMCDVIMGWGSTLVVLTSFLMSVSPLKFETLLFKFWGYQHTLMPLHPC